MAIFVAFGLYAATLGYADIGGMDSSGNSVYIAKKDGTKYSATFFPLTWTQSAPYYMEHLNEVGKKEQKQISSQEFEKLWTNATDVKLFTRHQIEGDRPPPDGGYCFLMFEVKDNEKATAQKQQIVFRRDTQTYKELQPFIDALKASAPKIRSQCPTPQVPPSR